MGAYYNEFDPKAAQWLRELIKGGHIADGDVDDRSITEVTRDDVKGYDQCHFFAGIGGWSLALRLAGWPDTGRNVWTGSPPCQPFSAAGQRKGAADARNLWPVYVRLIAECHPSALFGEQVAAAISNGWLDAVFADLESEGYACAATVLPACSVGSPHIRQRLWIVADALRAGHSTQGHSPQDSRQSANGCVGSGAIGIVADTDGGQSRQQHGQQPTDASIDGCGFSGSGSVELGEPENIGHERAGTARRRRRGLADSGELGNTNDTRPQGHRRPEPEHDEAGRQGAQRHDRQAGFWDSLEWLPCADGKARPTESRFQPMADELSDSLGYRRDGDRYILSPLIQKTKNRVMRLRGYGNAINVSIAQAFIEASVDAISIQADKKIEGKERKAEANG
jgi:DNA (cytosine-5)-methyltransferase 1